MQGINGIRTGMDVGKKASNSKPSYPVLLQRVWFVSTYSGEITADQIPVGTNFVRAKGVGAGGHYSGTIIDGGGAGGVYCERLFFYNSGTNLDWGVGQYGATDPNRDTVLQMGGSTVLLAPAGGVATSGSSGVSNSSRAIGDTIRAGTSGSSRQGGNAGNDLGDITTLNLFGNGASTSTASSGFGAGCAVQQTSPTTANYFNGTDGVLVIEFWTKDPR